LDIPLRRAHSIVSAPSRSETVAVLRETWIESRLQYLKKALLDESVQDSWDAQLSHPSSRLRNHLLFHRLRPERSREQLLANPYPVRHQIHMQFFHRHPVNPRTALVLPHALERSSRVRAFDHRFHQAAVAT
jgi:hypothetical protein